MKKSILHPQFTILAALLLALCAHAGLTNNVAGGSTNQTFLSASTVVTNVIWAPVLWRGTNAQIIAAQLEQMTNSAGQPILPAAVLNKGTALVTFRLISGTNGVAAVTGRVQ
jgi:hypothetical protein